VKLYVCWGTFPVPWRPGGHPCRNAHEALTEAGWEPEVERVYGLGPLPDALTPTRRKVRELTGQNWVPVLVTDDEEVVQGSKEIVAWAQANRASGAATRAS
jgi:Glutathione S-transferase, N-terminal domain